LAYVPFSQRPHPISGKNIRVCSSGDRVKLGTAQFVDDQGVAVYIAEAKELCPKRGYEIQEALNGHDALNAPPADLRNQSRYATANLTQAHERTPGRLQQVARFLPSPFRRGGLDRKILVDVFNCLSRRPAPI
jgi:hypothetical protein